jgi:ribosomal protein S18 acetylase RimI-like enzyme
MPADVPTAPVRESIREATPADGKAYQHILERSSRQDRYYRFLRFVNVVQESELSGYLGGPDTVAFIAEQAGEPIGIIHAAIEDSRAELAIIVIPEGRNHGLGRELVERLIEELRRRGVRELTAYSMSENEHFAALVTHCGMRRANTEHGVDLWRLDL